jgi:hypothetical protein
VVGPETTGLDGVVRSWRRHPTVRGNAHGDGMATKWRFS